MSERDFNITKLSKKVQDYIMVIEARNRNLTDKVKLATGEKKSKVQVEPWDNIEKYLSDNATIRFTLGDHRTDYLDVRKEGKTVMIMSGKALDIRPKATNVVTLKVGELSED